MKIAEAAARKRANTYHLCVFGDPKTGKSTLASKLAEAGYKLLWLSFDNGHSVLNKLSPAAQDRVELFVFPDTKDSPVAVASMLRIMTGKETLVCDAHGIAETQPARPQSGCPVCKKDASATFTRICLNEVLADTIVVVDNLSSLASSAMNLVIIDSIRKSMNDASGKKEDDPDVFKAGLDQYALQGRIMDKLLTNMQQFAVNFVCITHVIETVTEARAKKLVPLIGTTSFSGNAGKYFDHVVYAVVQNKKHTFGSATTFDSAAVTGSRTDVRIEDMKEPSLAPFFEMPAAEKPQHGTAAVQRMIEDLAPSVSNVLTEEKIDGTLAGHHVDGHSTAVAATSGDHRPDTGTVRVPERTDPGAATVGSVDGEANTAAAGADRTTGAQLAVHATQVASASAATPTKLSALEQLKKLQGRR
jgi:hypothetical protein